MHTQLQKEACEHNYKIFSTRGMYGTVLKLDMPATLNLELTVALDKLLIYYGAIPEQEHRRIILEKPTNEIKL